MFCPVRGGETDVVAKRIPRRIQVWHDGASVADIPARELACFQREPPGHESAESILVTSALEDIIDTGATRVRCIPAVCLKKRDVP